MSVARVNAQHLPIVFAVRETMEAKNAQIHNLATKEKLPFLHGGSDINDDTSRTNYEAQAASFGTIAQPDAESNCFGKKSTASA